MSILITALTGCEFDDGDGDDEAGTPAEICNSECEEPMMCFAQHKITKEWIPGDAFCADDIIGIYPEERHGNLISHCRMLMDVTEGVKYELLSCPGNSIETCPDWSPADAVTRKSSWEFEVQRSWVESLLLDPTPLGRCDQARIISHDSAPGLEFANVAPGDFVHGLGFESGDVVVGINHILIHDFEDALVALATFSALAEDEYRVVVERDGVPTEFSYTVTP